MNCPVPEEQNTRGRRIHPPEESIHGFGILTTKQIPSVSNYFIFIKLKILIYKTSKIQLRFHHFLYILDVVKCM